MTTWQAVIHAPCDAVVLMTGDSREIINTLPGEGQCSDILVSYSYSTSMQLPCSTLAIAVGYWKSTPLTDQVDCSRFVPTFCHHPRSECTVNYSSNEVLPCRLFAAESRLESVSRELKPYISLYLQAAYKLLGPHPFPRLDLLVTPACFASMGLASPNLMFISQSLVAGDGSMCIRLAHEISHAWFGLLIGARDWTEEWLSEGFATYMEDIIHAEAMKWTTCEAREHSELRALIRYKMLTAELASTEEELQTLRPQGESRKNDDDHAAYVKNGMNPEKGFTQVHYLKGYFLLRYLSNLVGQTEFVNFLRQYVEVFHGQLVLSKDVLALYFKTFPSVPDLTIGELFSKWLDCPGMPKELEKFELDGTNTLYNSVLQHTAFWRSLIKGRRNKRRKVDFSHLCQLESDQVVLVLESLLDIDNIQYKTLLQLRQHYNYLMKNADVLHRFCELVVKHKHTHCYPEVENFLLHHQAMGVYIFSELVHSGCKRQRHLANDCYNRIQIHMDDNSRKVVLDMMSSVDL